MLVRLSILAALALVPYGCNSNNVAADYIAKNGSGAASDLKTGDSQVDTSKDKKADELDDEKTAGNTNDPDDMKSDDADKVDDSDMDDKADEPAVPAPKKEEDKTPTPAAGDAVAGAAILKSTCSLCHAPGKPAAGVTLNAAAIARLDDAINGAQKANHAGFKDNFVAPKRADLEAGMKAAK